MDQLYSTALLAAIIFSVVAWFCLLLSGFVFGSGRARQKLRRIGLATSVAALLFGAVSCLVHFFAGHTPGSPEDLGLLGFFQEHPAFVVVALLAATSLFTAKKLSRERD